VPQAFRAEILVPLNSLNELPHLASRILLIPIAMERVQLFLFAREYITALIRIVDAIVRDNQPNAIDVPELPMYSSRD
jgi:hypothetical protein